MPDETRLDVVARSVGRTVTLALKLHVRRGPDQVLHRLGEIAQRLERALARIDRSAPTHVDDRYAMAPGRRDGEIGVELVGRVGREAGKELEQGARLLE